MGHEELLRKLTGMAAEVVRDCRVEQALGWLLCNRRKDPLPQVPHDLFDKLVFVRDEGRQEVDAAYKGCDYFEDCLRLAFRKSQSVALSSSEKRHGPDGRARTRRGRAAAFRH